MAFPIGHIYVRSTVPDSDTAAWALIVEAPAGTSAASIDGAEPWPRVLGLTLPLRLALTAQAAGATAIVLADRDTRTELRRLLTDARLLLPVIDESDSNRSTDLRALPSIRIPANSIVHAATLRAAAKWLQDELIRRPAATDARTEMPTGVLPTGVLPTGVLPTIALSPGAVPHDLIGVAGPYGFDPMLVADTPSALAAEKALLRALRKPQDGWTAIHLNRGISLWLTRRLVNHTSLTPNQMSVGILGIGLLGAALASRGGYGPQLAGALLFQAQSVLDGCDGEISRVTFRGSRAGEWLDTIGDDLTNYGFFAGASWGLYITSGRPLYLGLGLLMVLSGLIGSGLEYRYLVRIGSGDLLKYPIGIGKSPGRAAPRTAFARAVDAISPLFKRDTFVFLTLVGAALGWLGPFLAAFSAGAVAVLAAVIRAELAMRRERTAAQNGTLISPPPGGPQTRAG